MQAAALAQGLVSLLPQLAALSDILPPPTLAWKLQLLEEGNRCAVLCSNRAVASLTFSSSGRVLGYAPCWVGQASVELGACPNS